MLHWHSAHMHGDCNGSFNSNLSGGPRQQVYNQCYNPSASSNNHYHHITVSHVPSLFGSSTTSSEIISNQCNGMSSYNENGCHSISSSSASSLLNHCRSNTDLVSQLPGPPNSSYNRSQSCSVSMATGDHEEEAKDRFVVIEKGKCYVDGELVQGLSPSQLAQVRRRHRRPGNSSVMSNSSAGTSNERCLDPADSEASKRLSLPANINLPPHLLNRKSQLLEPMTKKDRRYSLVCL